LDTLVTDQTITVGEGESQREVALANLVNEYYEWHISQLNNAAAKWNTPPQQVNGNWVFKGSPNSKGVEPGYHSLFSTFFTNLENSFYEDKIFIKVLHDLVTPTTTLEPPNGTYCGYRGIYDDADSKITALITKLKTQWTEVLKALDGNAAELEAYFNDSYPYSVWEPTTYLIKTISIVSIGIDMILLLLVMITLLKVGVASHGQLITKMVLLLSVMLLIWLKKSLK
jgi:hypothetical protein